MKIKKLEVQPKEITEVFIEANVVFTKAVLMPQGEVICRGKTVGWLEGKDSIQLYIKE